MKISKGLVYFLLSPTLAGHEKNDTETSTTTISNVNLDYCQEQICQQWNEFLYKQFYEDEPMELYENRPKIKNWLETHDFRCNPYNTNYKRYTSIDICMRDLCNSVQLTGKNRKECFIDPDKITLLWNKFCSKNKFNKLSSKQKSKFFRNCLKQICHDRKKNEINADSDVLCMSTSLSRSLKKLKKLFKNLINKEKKIENKKNISIHPTSHPINDLPNDTYERVISITASAIGILSSVVGMIGAGWGLYAARAAITSVNSAFPHVSEGLKHIVDGTLAYARRASMMPSTFLSPASTHRLSQISSEISAIYQNAYSSPAFSSETKDLTDFKEFTFNFKEEVEETNLGPNNNHDEKVEEINLKSEDHDEKVEEINLKSEDYDESSEKVVKTIRYVPENHVTYKPLWKKLLETYVKSYK